MGPIRITLELPEHPNTGWRWVQKPSWLDSANPEIDESYEESNFGGGTKTLVITIPDTMSITSVVLEKTRPWEDGEIDAALQLLLIQRPQPTTAVQLP